MNEMPPIHFKGTTYNLDTELYVWKEKVKSVSLCCKGYISELEKQIDVRTILREKVSLVQALNKEEIRKFIEKETEEKIDKLKLVKIIFDFAEPEDDLCSVDLYLGAGKTFGGFTVHLRLHGDIPRSEMCGLSFNLFICE